MVEFEADYMGRMRNALAQFVNELASFAEGYCNEPSTGSQARREQSAFNDPEYVASVWSLGSIFIEHGFEHLCLFVKAIDRPPQAIACWTCVRSMLEACALATWLLDPATDARERVARHFAHRYEGLVEQKKFLSAAGVSRAEMQVADEEIGALIKKSSALGFRPVENRNGEPIGIHCVKPSTTELIHKVLAEGIMYRIGSAVTHSHHWAIHELCYEKVAGEFDLGGVAASALAKRPHVVGVPALGLCAMRSLARPVLAQTEYFGWDRLKLEELIEGCADKLRASTARKVRFWRTDA